MHQIAKTPRYTLAVDPIKNRLYSAKIGFWQDIFDNPDFIEHIHQAIQHLSKGFTILSDLTQLQVLSHEWVEVMIEVHKIFVKADCAGKAEIAPETAVARLQFKRIAESSGIQKQEFASKVEAEAWLDQISKKAVKS